jgi:hypothetical protein
MASPARKHCAGSSPESDNITCLSSDQGVQILSISGACCGSNRALGNTTLQLPHIFPPLPKQLSHVDDTLVMAGYPGGYSGLVAAVDQLIDNLSSKRRKHFSCCANPCSCRASMQITLACSLGQVSGSISNSQHCKGLRQRCRTLSCAFQDYCCGRYRN